MTLTNPCDRAELVVRRLENCGLIVIADNKRQSVIDHIRIALDTEVASGGPYLLKNIEDYKD